MSIIAKTTMIDLGDTGTLNVKPVKGGVQFTIGDGARPVSSLVVPDDKALWIADCIRKCVGAPDIGALKQ